MTRDDPRSLVALTAVRRDRETARLRDVLAEEARLRTALARLAAQAAEARVLPDATLAGLREIGADLAWQDWVARQRAALNSALALNLARKEQALPALRRAFGKAEAARALAAQHQTAKQAKTLTREAQSLDHLGLMRLARSRDQTS